LVFVGWFLAISLKSLCRPRMTHNVKAWRWAGIHIVEPGANANYNEKMKITTKAQFIMSAGTIAHFDL